jgi:HAD superfamily hydrolase (TIGR01662 family)
MGWRVAGARWVAFLDDDVVPPLGWAEALVRDLESAPVHVGGVQGRVRVPLPADRRPTDWERNVAGLEGANWATADMAYRRDALLAVGGFDERFRHAYREDADLAQRVINEGYQLVLGDRHVVHPVRPAGPWISVRLQRGNADDVLIEALHGPHWAGRPAGGRRKRHEVITSAAATALLAAVTRRRLPAVAATAIWAAGTAELLWARIAPGPRTSHEVATMAMTSVLIPPAATYHRLAGLRRRRRLLQDVTRAPLPSQGVRPEAVLFDRDGTLVVDVPYNGDPDRVVPMPGAREALRRLRAAGVPTAVISNQSGVARRVLTEDQVVAVNRRVEELLGPLGPWVYCPHGLSDACPCRKPAPGMVIEAATRLGIHPSRVAVIGDIGSDMDAARAAGARGVLVPTAVTRPEEITAAPEVAPDLESAVDVLLLGSR